MLDRKVCAEVSMDEAFVNVVDNYAVDYRGYRGGDAHKTDGPRNKHT